jgi:DNA repair exonuclease SbcCD ATPase subunit
LNKYELIKYLIDLSATERREGLTTINQTLETFMATTNEKLNEAIAKLTSFEAVLVDVDGDITELKEEITKLAAEIPENATVTALLDKVDSLHTKLKATADRVPEVTPEPTV